MEEPKKPFWRTIPGVLTQIAGVVTALSAIGGGGVQYGVVGGGGYPAVLSLNASGRGGTGRRAGFRTRWAESSWRFKSSRPHSLP